MLRRGASAALHIGPDAGPAALLPTPQGCRGARLPPLPPRSALPAVLRDQGKSAFWHTDSVLRCLSGRVPGRLSVRVNSDVRFMKFMEDDIQKYCLKLGQLVAAIVPTVTRCVGAALEGRCCMFTHPITRCAWNMLA